MDEIDGTRRKLFWAIAILQVLESSCASRETNFDHVPAIVADVAEAVRSFVQESVEELEGLRIGHERRPEESADTKGAT